MVGEVETSGYAALSRNPRSTDASSFESSEESAEEVGYFVRRVLTRSFAPSSAWAFLAGTLEGEGGEAGRLGGIVEGPDGEARGVMRTTCRYLADL